MIDNQTGNPFLPTIENAATFFEKAEAFITKYKLGSIITTATTAIASTGAAIASGTLSVPMTAFIAFAAVAIAATAATIFIVVIAKKNNQTDINLKNVNGENKTQTSQRRRKRQQSTNDVQKNKQTQEENKQTSKDQKSS